MEDKIVIISIHPKYADKIITGEKRLEFRRSWAKQPVSKLVIYATSPIKKFVAIVEIKQTFVGSKNKLWNLAKSIGGGISRRNLFSYLEGKKTAVAIELINIKPILDGLDPKSILGSNFRPPQSFMYLKENEFEQILKQTKE